MEKETNHNYLSLILKYNEIEIILSIDFTLNGDLVKHFWHLIVLNFIFPLVFFCSSMELFHNQLIKLKEIFGKNGYNSIYLKKWYIVPRKIYLYLPNPNLVRELEKLSVLSRLTLQKNIRDFLSSVNLNLDFSIKDYQRFRSKFRFQRLNIKRNVI